MSLQSLCKPRLSAFAADRRATVLNLDTFLKGEVNGNEFFDENYFTSGMLTLVDRAFRHLGGSGAGSSVFLLSQAMGGGKTHSMIALGLLARDPELRKKCWLIRKIQRRTLVHAGSLASMAEAPMLPAASGVRLPRSSARQNSSRVMFRPY